MSTASDAAKVLAAALDAQDEQRRERDSELAAQMSSVRRELAADRRIGDDRFETLNAKLDRILQKLGTNGSGGH
jgi:hypothetical protein